MAMGALFLLLGLGRLGGVHLDLLDAGGLAHHGGDLVFQLLAHLGRGGKGA